MGVTRLHFGDHLRRVYMLTDSIGCFCHSLLDVHFLYQLIMLSELSMFVSLYVRFLSLLSQLTYRSFITIHGALIRQCI